MPRLFVLLVSLVLCGVASGAPGPVVPMIVPPSASVQLYVGVDAGGDSAQLGGALPVSLPFNLSSGSCTAFGTATLANVSGGLEIQVSGGALTADCDLRVSTSGLGPELEVDIPASGDVLTPVYTFVSYTGTTTGGVFPSDADGELNADYTSAFLGGLSVLPQAPVWLGNPIAAIGPNLYVAGDAVDLIVSDLSADWFAFGTPGTIDSTVRFELFVPPTAAPAAPALSGPGRAVLTALLIGFAGFFFARKRVHGGAVAAVLVLALTGDASAQETCRAADITTDGVVGLPVEPTP